MAVLITVPKLELHGGVANYYKVLRSYLPGDVDYFAVGKRSEESNLATVCRVMADYASFKRTIPSYALICLNPSLAAKAVVRDGLLLRAAKIQRKKVIVFIHGWDKAYEAGLRKRWLWLFRRYYFQADAFVVLAREFDVRLREMGYQGRVFVETTVVDDSAYQSNVEPVTKPADTFTVLFLSRVERRKGIYEAIDAVNLLQATAPQVNLVVAGDGEELEAVKRYAATHGARRVSFSGYVRGEDKTRLLASSHAYILPSYGEGMPTAVLEAMASGLPIIARPVGGLADFFEEAKMGFMTNSLEPRVFADLISALAADPKKCQEIGEHNRCYARERFMAPKVAGRLLRIYESVLE